ncbi:hypothetical protein BDZ85DRAFT_320472 [Elsinoe ampelina]|uniref:Uncharacterized protein n=1 Tax=Elsinoe ampelina TaxID=302913 RepID=A0A6A6G6E8_9PEZI|nr:hypothetical protein BDZ85DRAFT_320472 [Elsinoe ampelina]
MAEIQGQIAAIGAPSGGDPDRGHPGLPPMAPKAELTAIDSVKRCTNCRRIFRWYEFADSRNPTRQGKQCRKCRRLSPNEDPIADNHAEATPKRITPSTYPYGNFTAPQSSKRASFVQLPSPSSQRAPPPLRPAAHPLATSRTPDDPQSSPAEDDQSLDHPISGGG